MNPIKFATPDCGDAEAQAAAEVIRSGWIVGGPKLAELEGLFAQHTGRKHAVGVTSWTTGGFLALYAWGIGPGDEVIVPSYSFIATANVVRHVGATPVFADIDPVTWNLDPKDVEKRITAKTKAIIPVDQIGLPCDMDAFEAIAERHGLKILEDAACAIGSVYRGSPVGAKGDCCIFSMHARKVVTTGEGGMIVTDDDAFAAKLRLLRHQGMSISDVERHNSSSTTFEEYPVVGFNFRLTDVQAAMGIPQMQRLDTMMAERRAIAERYQQAFANHPLIQAPWLEEGSLSNWQSYMIGLSPNAKIDRNTLMEKLDQSGITTRRSIMASHLEPAYSNASQPLPATEEAFRVNLLLPMHNGLQNDQQEYIIDTILNLLG